MQDHRGINLFLFILPRNEGLPQKIQTTNLNLIDSLQEEDKKRTITLRLVFWISLTTDSAMCNGKCVALRSSKSQINGDLSRMFIHSHCKVRSHNPKGGCPCREKKKRIPVFNRTFCVQSLNITTPQNSITENGNGLNNLCWYKAIVRCTHLFASILQHGCKKKMHFIWVSINLARKC